MLMTAPDRTQGLEQLVETHQRGVWRFLRFIGASTTEADDLTQETLIEAWRNPPADKGGARTGAWLRSVARNKLLMLRRADKRRPVVPLEAAERVFVQTAGEAGGDDHIAALRRCLETLRGRAQEAVRLFYSDGHSRVETARLMQMNEEGVKTLLRRAKEALRECVQKRQA